MQIDSYKLARVKGTKGKPSVEDLIEKYLEAGGDPDYVIVGGRTYDAFVSDEPSKPVISTYVMSRKDWERNNA